MSEPQYKRYSEIPCHTLGVMANQLWHEDPKMLGIHLARYKFVAKMLAGKKNVAEIGCGDGWYSRVVGQAIGGELQLYDFDQGIKPHGAVHHDILNGSIGTRDYGLYEAIYSLDVMEHITSDKEHIYLKNICSSLKNNGVFIVGMPSLESQAYASPASKTGHVNCKSGDDLKQILEQYFHNVFMFGMNDETIHTGFFPMCHYLIGVCAGVR